jgi:hypothetical protein
MDRDEQLPGEIARLGWIILGVLFLLSFLLRSLPVSFGVLGGGLTALLGYHWLHLNLLRALGQPDGRAAKRFQIGYIIRLGTLACILYLLVAVFRVHPFGLAAGLSVVVLSIFWTTFKRMNSARRQ